MKVKLNSQKIDFLIVSGSTVLCSVATFLYNLFVKKYVMPYEFGIFTTANLVLLYLGYLQFGVLNSYNRDYPRLLGAGNNVAAAKLRQCVYTYILVIYGVVALIGMGASYILVKTGVLSQMLGVGIAVNAVNAGLTNLYNYFDNSTKAEGKIIYTAIVQISRTAVQIVIGILAVRNWGYYGMFVAILAAALLPFAFYAKRITSLRVSFDRQMIKELILSGAPLLINAFVWTVMMSIDKFVILFFMTQTELGIYSTALLGFSTLVLVPSSISQVFYIRMSRSFGESNDKKLLVGQASQFAELTGFITSAVALIAYYVLPIIIRVFIPGYAAGIPSAKILIIGVSLYSTTMMYGNVFSILKLNAKLLKTTVCLCILNTMFSSALVVVFGKQIEYVAYGTAVAYALYSVLLVTTLGRVLGESSVSMLIKSWMPVLVTVVPCLVLSRFVASEYLAFIYNLVISGALELCTFLYLRRRNKSI